MVSSQKVTNGVSNSDGVVWALELLKELFFFVVLDLETVLLAISSLLALNVEGLDHSVGVVGALLSKNQFPAN